MHLWTAQDAENVANEEEGHNERSGYWDPSYDFP